MKKSNKNVRTITYAAVIAALYVVLTFVAALLKLSSGVIQVRFSEALTVLPIFTPAAIPGVAVGCLLANILTGAIPADIIFGTAATLIGALCTYALRRRPTYIAVLPPIIANTIVVPFVLKFGYGADGGIPFFMLTVGVGEIISCGVFGVLLATALKKHNKSLFS